MIDFRRLQARLPGRFGHHQGADAAPVDLVLLLLLGVLILSSGLGLRDAWAPDEPRFALIAKEMVESGEWLLPHRAAELYDHKPPLFFWSIALVYTATGSMRVALLLPSLLAGLVTVAAVYGLGRSLWHRRAGLGAGLTLLLLIIQFPLHAKTGQIDTMATMWTTLGLYGLCHHLLRGPDWRSYNLGWFAMGLGVITKGVGFLPILMLLPWAIAKHRRWPRLPKIRPGGWRWWTGPGLFLLATCLWLIPMLTRVATSNDPDLTAYRDEILWGQTAERYAALEGGHQQPLWYYPAQVIPTLWLPLVLFLPWLLPAWWRRLRRRDSRYLLLLGWVLLVILFFTFGSGKRGLYILPATPALALAAGPLVAGLERLRGPQRMAFGFLVVFSTLLVGLAAGGLLGVEWPAEIEDRQGIRPWGLIATLGLVGLALAIRSRTRTGLRALAGFFFCAWLLYGWWGYPLINPLRTPKDLMAKVDEHIGPFAELAMIGWKEQLVLYADRPVTHWGFVPDHESEAYSDDQGQAAAAWLNDTSESRWLLAWETWLDPCFSREHATDLGVKHRKRWFLLDRSALTGACGPGTDEWAEPPLRSYRTREDSPASLPGS